MGRKIPGKRHKGVKDPEKQRAKRLSELAPKINAPPKNIDAQAVPRSLERVIKLKEAVKTGKIGKVTKKKKVKNKLISVGGSQTKLHSKAKPDKVVPLFQQNPGENPYHFYHRVCKETDHFIKETNFEAKYNVQVNRNPDTGEIVGMSKLPKDELDELAKLRAKHKNIKKKKKVRPDDSPKLTKVQKRKQKLQHKKEKKEQEKIDEFKTFNDKIKFGEVVHAPPHLLVKARKSEDATVRKPARAGLLLTAMLNGPGNKADDGKTLSIDRSGKRKKLPVGERRQLEKHQKEAIAAYRQLKQQTTVFAN